MSLEIIVSSDVLRTTYVQISSSKPKVILAARITLLVE